MNFPSFLSLCIHSQPLFGKVSKQSVYKPVIICSNNNFVISLRMIRVKYNSFYTDMGIQAMSNESQQKNKNFVFAVQITDLIPIYAFRVIPFT